MKQPDFKLEFIKDNQGFKRLVETLETKQAFALDIETTEWWNRQREKIALIQLAFRHESMLKVAVVDSFARLDFEILKVPFEKSSITKIIHNAGFDVPRLAKYFDFNVTPVHDTMLAARSNGERKCSLKSQAELHLHLYLDKSQQRSDFGRRPLHQQQLFYAAYDAYATFRLYENQISRNLKGDYRSKKEIASRQFLLPLDDLSETETISASATNLLVEPSRTPELTNLSAALLGIAVELPTRYSPDSLAVSLGHERIGLAGWIIDQRLGVDVDLDEETVKLTIADLCEHQLVKISETRRIEATEKGNRLWQTLKTV